MSRVCFFDSRLGHAFHHEIVFDFGKMLALDDNFHRLGRLRGARDRTRSGRRTADPTQILCKKLGGEAVSILFIVGDDGHSLSALSHLRGDVDGFKLPFPA